MDIILIQPQSKDQVKTFEQKYFEPIKQDLIYAWKR